MTNGIWEILRDWIDNPIFIKHVRSRLRLQPLAVAVVVVVLLCMCIVWAGYENDAFVNGRAFEWLVLLQAVILIIMGASQVSAAVGGARLSGILDFHRVSPLTPAQLTLGFLFGAPIREYVLFACTLPFVALFMAFGVPTVHGFVQLMILLLSVAWVFHGLALLNSLIMKPGRTARGAVGVVIFFLMFFLYAMRMGRFIPSIALFDDGGRLDFFGASLPWLAVLLFYIGGLLFFIYLSTSRRISEERIHPLSKLQAIAALAALSVLSLGGIWRKEDNGIVQIVVLYVLILAAVLLVMMVTPNRPEYFKGLWRAKKQGRATLPWWADLSLNRVFLVIVCTITLIAATLAQSALAEPMPGSLSTAWSPGNYHLAFAIGVLVVAYFGLASQYFMLRFGRRGTTFFALFMFLVWVMPIVAGTISAMASMERDGGTFSQVFFGLTPVSGIAMVAAPGNDSTFRTAIEGPAITPALLFTFVFNGLLISARRRAYKEFITASADAEKSDVAPAAAQWDAAELEGDGVVIRPKASS